MCTLSVDICPCGMCQQPALYIVLFVVIIGQWQNSVCRNETVMVDSNNPVITGYEYILEI